MVVVGVAAVVPLALAAVPRVAVPGAVVEICAGIALGPAVLGVVEVDEAVRTLATVGLAFLLFLAGLEIDLRALRGRPGRQAARGLGLSLVLAALVGTLLQVAGVVDDGRLLTVLLLATSLGLVVPVLRDAGLTGRPAGRLIVAGASLGELAALVLLSLLFSQSARGPGAVLLLLLLVAGVAVAVLVLALRLSASPRVAAVVSMLADTSAQVRVRLAVLLVVGMAALAERLGFEAILGAFVAGLVLRLADADGMARHPHFQIKLEGLGFGFLVPVFFVASGVAFEVDALLDEPAGLLQIPAFLVALLVVRALPAVAYRPELAWREVAAAGLLQATSLPFLVVGAAIGQELGLLAAADAAALVGAGLLSVVLFPALALGLASGRQAAPEPLVSGAA